jgi:hypothetical protein
MVTAVDAIPAGAAGNAPLSSRYPHRNYPTLGDKAQNDGAEIVPVMSCMPWSQMARMEGVRGPPRQTSRIHVNGRSTGAVGDENVRCDYIRGVGAAFKWR